MSSARRRRFGSFLTVAALAGLCLAGLATPAQAATVNLFAAPSAVGTGDCSSPDNACTIDIAVTTANAASVTDEVVIKLAKGTYQLSAPDPALSITFAGPGLTFEPQSGTPTLSGTKTVSVLSIGATSNVTIAGLGIEFGESAGLGGGIQNSGTLTVEDSTFTGNAAGNGGAIANNSGATLTVQDSTFSHNTTTGVGGGAIINSGMATVMRSAIINNTAPINGGGINVQPGGTMTLANSTIANNTSAGLGGGFSNLGTLNLLGSTITDNAGSDGTAFASGNTNVTFAATILAGPSSGGTCNPANAAYVDGGYNLDDDGTCISPTSPATGSHNGTTTYGSSTYGAALGAYLADGLANNGGPTKTIALLNSPDPSTDVANPALDVVPPSFDLPVAIGGTSAACSLSDQRGVVPAAGSNCDIGAYLLQATKTELAASTETVGQNESVTYTAAVTPAPDGGTVSFNDGAGNPAAANCAAQGVANGKATCTVSYANLGSYSVTASYTGDEAKNNYAASATAAPTTTTVVDKTQPSKPRKVKGRIQGGKLRLSWNAPSDNVGIDAYRVLSKGKVVKSTTGSVRRASVTLTGRGGGFAIRAVDAAGNISPGSQKVKVRRVHGAYRIVK